MKLLAFLSISFLLLLQVSVEAKVFKSEVHHRQQPSNPPPPPIGSGVELHPSNQTDNSEEDNKKNDSQEISPAMELFPALSAEEVENLRIISCMVDAFNSQPTSASFPEKAKECLKTPQKEQKDEASVDDGKKAAYRNKREFYYYPPRGGTAQNKSEGGESELPPLPQQQNQEGEAPQKDQKDEASVDDGKKTDNRNKREFYYYPPRPRTPQKDQKDEASVDGKKAEYRNKREFYYYPPRGGTAQNKSEGGETDHPGTLKPKTTTSVFVFGEDDALYDEILGPHDTIGKVTGDPGLPPKPAPTTDKDSEGETDHLGTLSRPKTPQPLNNKDEEEGEADHPGLLERKTVV